LAAAAAWLAGYEGKNPVRAYRRHFGVDLLCALKELEMIGVKFSPQYVLQLPKSVAGRIRAGRERKQEKTRREEIDMYPDSDRHFAFIAGYTEGGFPYGITWEEEEAFRRIEERRE